MAEWLRRWTWNPLGSARAGSNPVGTDIWEHTAFSETLKHRWRSGLTRPTQDRIPSGAQVRTLYDASFITLTAIFMFCPKRNQHQMLRGFESRHTHFTKGVYPSGLRRFTNGLCKLWTYSVVVSTRDFESRIRSSNLRRFSHSHSPWSSG